MRHRDESYGFSRDHLRRIADNHRQGYHVVGMGGDYRRFSLSVGGDVTIPGLWDE